MNIPVLRGAVFSLDFVVFFFVKFFRRNENVLLHNNIIFLKERKILCSFITAEQLFQHLYVTSCPASQLSTAALLSQSDDTYRWMPNFLADVLRKTLSSDPSTSLIPKDR
jgi:hypothetical protein